MKNRFHFSPQRDEGGRGPESELSFHEGMVLLRRKPRLPSGFAWCGGRRVWPLYKWVEENPPAKELVQLPNFRREVIFADPELNQWSTGVMPSNIAEQIKAAIVLNKAPVHVIYNH